MANLKEPNPLDIFNLRRTEFCPSHFSTVNIQKRYNLEQSISEWIEYNLKGRFFIGPNVELDNENKIQSVYTVGFENPKELSFFMLACPHLKYV
jgi:hypothetical protein